MGKFSSRSDHGRDLRTKTEECLFLNLLTFSAKIGVFLNVIEVIDSESDNFFA